MSFTGRQNPNSVSGHGPNTNQRCHHTSTRELGDRLAQLLEFSLSKTSLTMYHRLWQILQQFIRDGLGIQIQLYPLSTHTLALFIAFLAEKNYAASTVSSYIYFCTKFPPSLSFFA